MSYFSGSSIPKWILGSDVEELFTPEPDSKVCIIKDVVFSKNVGTDSGEFFIFILTDGNYYIPALLLPSSVTEHFEISSQLTVQDLSRLKQEVIMIENSAVGALRIENKTIPYLIVVDWKPLAEQPQKMINPNIQCVTKHEKVSRWITSLNDSLEENCISQDTRLSNVFRSKVIKRKFVNFNKLEPVLEKLIFEYLNDNTEQSTREIATHIPRKRSVNDSYSTQPEKRSKPAVIAMSSSSQPARASTPLVTAINSSSQLEETNRSSRIVASSSSQPNIPNRPRVSAPISSSQPSTTNKSSEITTNFSSQSSNPSIITPSSSSQPNNTSKPSIITPSSSSQPSKPSIIASSSSSQPSKPPIITPSSSSQPENRSRPSEITVSFSSQPGKKLENSVTTVTSSSQISNIGSEEWLTPKQYQQVVVGELWEKMNSVPDKVYIDILNDKETVEDNTKETVEDNTEQTGVADTIKNYIQWFALQSNDQKNDILLGTVDQGC